jgi:protein gp37
VDLSFIAQNVFPPFLLTIPITASASENPAAHRYRACRIVNRRTDLRCRIEHVRSEIEHMRVQVGIRFISFEPLLTSVASADLTGIQWAIVGGESRPRSRPMLEEWVDEIESACRESGTAFFFKQWGGVRKKVTGRTYRDRTFDEMPVISGG